jgi:hypothetical protein
MRHQSALRPNQKSASFIIVVVFVLATVLVRFMVFIN